MISGMIDSAKNTRLNGVLVRSFIHASNVPIPNAISDDPIAKRSESATSRPVPVLA